MLGIGLFRLVLALAVVITHTYPVWGFTFGNPVIAVRAFFIISGFYMTMILTEKYTQTKLFWFNRFLKIYPIYWTLLFLTILSCIGAFLIRNNWGEMYTLVNRLPGLNLKDQLLIITSHITIFGRGIIQSANYNGISGISFLLIPQAWTLVLELWFYLLIPFVYKNKLLIISLFVLSLKIKYLVNDLHPGDHLWIYRFFPAELCYFLLGWFAYKFYRRINKSGFKPGVFWTIITLIFLSYFNYMNLEINLREWLFYSSLVFLIPLVFKYSKESKIDRQMGELSYPVYISHILVNNIVNPLIMLPLAITKNWQAPLIFACSVMLSVIINRFVQHPIEQFRKVSVK